MNATSEVPTENRSDVKAGVVKRFVQIAVFFLIQAVILFWASGQITWTWAWVFLAVSFAVVLINGTIMLRTHLETVAERGQPKDMKSWDKIIALLYSLFLYLALPLVAAFDIRWGWTGGIHNIWHVAGAVALAAGYGFGSWAMVVNAFFSTAVRIQTDRGQTVCRSGPYRFVRHPGYVGFSMQSLATPILLGSAWALIPALAAAAVLIVRTALEDRTLQAELPGYRDYTQEVRYRLIPGVW